MLTSGEQHKATATSNNPFEETKLHISEYTAQDIATLSSRLEKQLGPEYISSRPGPSGQKVHYLAADKCINLANEVFGFNGWSSGIQNIQIDFVDENPNNGNISLGLSVIVRVTLRDGTFHEDIGYGQVKNVKDKSAAFEKAKKEGTTDGLKRALRNFGNLLGNCIYDKDYVSKVTKLKVVPSKWDPDNLHRHPDFVPIKKESMMDISHNQPEPSLPKRDYALDMGTSIADVEDEFGSDEFDEADLAVANDGHPDGVSLSSGMQLGHLRGKGGAPSKRQSQAARRGAPDSGIVQGPGTPSSRAINVHGQSLEIEPNVPSMPIQRVPQLALPQQQANVPRNRLQGHLAPQVPQIYHKPVEEIAPGSPKPMKSTNAPDGTPPTLDSSSATEHIPPIGFFTARAAETLQSSTTLPSNVPTFNPHLESPSIRKTAGVDHTRTKPVRAETIGTPAIAIPPKSNFVNPQTDKTRRVGMPMGAASPLSNRGSYKPPQMKRPADAVATQTSRPVLNDVTSASVNLSIDSGSDVKRQRTGEVVQDILET
ncbi:MAG: DNA repair protein rad52 [Heterodermia speciosa]|uniref:RAD52 homolog n=1 Tax=Heterodermia speciosa TaxID=116794 RepID=A0A8H3FW00_9LECA|nr:MAG: DNA repair protein rad52 [Heterodermia speciosa]